MSLSSVFHSVCQPLTPISTDLSPCLNKTFPKIKAVVFDIYGTLFISGSGDIGITTATQKNELLVTILKDHFQVAVEEGVSLTDRLIELVQKSHKESKEQGIDFPEVEIREIWRLLMNEVSTVSLSDEQIEELAVRYEAAVNPVWPMPNLEETIRTIRERGLSLGIVSNAQFYTPLLFDGFLGQSLPSLGFEDSLSFYSYQERQAKPGAVLYQKLKEALYETGIRAEETLYIGNDMLNDVSPANELGFQTVLFAGDARSLRLREEHNLSAPDAVVTDLSQILELLD